MSGQTQPEATLSAHLTRLLEWLKDVGTEHTWTRLVLVEREARRADSSLGVEEGASPEDFADRFAEILLTTTRDWVNLVAVRVEGEVLIVAVEYFGPPDDGRGVQAAAGDVRVNFSSELPT